MVRIGGDYMTGRFLSTPLLACVLIASQVEFENTVQPALAFAIVLAFGFTSPRPPIATTDTYAGLGSSPEDIDDERGYRANETALLRLNRDNPLSSTAGWIADGIAARRDKVQVIVHKNIGYFGYFAGPGVHIIDPYGLGDALMGRIPFNEGVIPWASGHFYREIPDGYPDAAIDKGPLKDPRMNAYWRNLETVTRGPIFSAARLRLVARFAAGPRAGAGPRPADEVATGSGASDRLTPREGRRGGGGSSP